MNRLKRIVDTAVLFAMLVPCAAGAQQAAGSSLGTVTALQGEATVGRAALPQPTSLKFRDDVFFRDQITTKAQATVRLLLGGKGVLTIREQSQVTLDESVAPTGERRSVLSLLGGKLAAAIARTLMRPGEEVEIRTPNAVAAVRGTVLIAEYIPSPTSAQAPAPLLLASADPGFQVAQAPTPAAGQTTFLVLTGSVTVTAQGAPPVTVGALQTVSVTGSVTGAQVGAVQTATQAQVAQATQGFQMDKSISGEGDGGKAAQAQAQLAATLANAIVQATSAASAPPPPAFQQPQSSPVPDTTQTPSLSTTTPQNDLPSGPLLQLTTLTMAVPTGTSVMTFGPGSPNTVVPIGVTGTGMESSVVALPAAGTFAITGNPITHSGPLLGMSAAALVANDSTTPLMQVNGTTFTNSGPLISLTGGSILSVSGPVLDITNGTLNAAGQPLMMLDSNNGFFTTTAAPAVRVSNGSLTADALLWTTGTGNFGVVSGPALEGSNADITLRVLGGDAIDIEGSNDIFQNPGPGIPQVRLTNSNLTLTEAGKPLVDPGSDVSPDYAGVGLIATNTSGMTKTITVNGPLLRLWYVNLLGTDPFIQLSNMTVQPTSPAIEVYDGSGNTTAGPLLSASGSTLNVNGTFVRARNGARLTATTSSPLLQFSGSTVATNGPLFKAGSDPGQPGSTVSLAGPLLSATNTGFNTGANSNFVNIVDGSTFRSTSALPFLTLDGGSLVTTSHVVRVGESNKWSGGVRVFDGSQAPVSMRLAGPLLSTTDTSITATSSILALRDGATLTSMTTLPLITLGQSGGTVGPTVSLGGPDPDPASPTYGQYSNGILFTMQPLLGQPIAASLAGSLLAANHATITTDRILSVLGNTGATSTLTDTTAAPLLSFSGSQASAALNFLLLSNNAPTMTLAGGLLAASNSTLTNGNPTANDYGFLFIGDSAHLTSTGSGSLLAFDGTSVVSSGPIVSIRRSNSPASPSMVTLSGGLFSATNNSSFSTTSLGYPGGTSACCSAFNISQGAQLVSTTAGSALITLTNSTFNVGPDARSGGQFFQVVDGPAYPGESNTLVAPSSVSLTGSLLMANGSRLSALYSLVYLNNSSVTDGYPGSPLIQFGTIAGNTITLGGLRTDPISPGSIGVGFLAYLNGSSTLSMQGPFLGSANDTLTATGGILRIGSGSTLISTTTNPLISLSGGTHTLGDASNNNARLLDMKGTHTDLTYGYGTDQPLQTGGIFFQASGATVNLTGGSSTGAAIKVDTALLNAAAPIVDLINSTVNLNNGSSSSPGAVQLLNAVANVTGPAVNLNNSVISIQNGPLLSLMGGAQMNVTGDLARLANGSRLTVVNGPLISVDGVNAKGTASSLIGSGALVNFVGSGNQVIVTNALTPNYTTGGGTVPVYTDNLSTASTNIMVGPYPVKNAGGGTVNLTGSLLKVTNGGKVNVSATAP